MRKVRANSLYRYDPVPLDRFHPPHNVEKHDIVRVVNLPSCPPANTMGHCHVQHLGGEFAGLVCCNSLVPLTAEEKRYVRRASTATSFRRPTTRYNLDLQTNDMTLDFKGARVHVEADIWKGAL
jgi:hypothetical protein